MTTSTPDDDASLYAAVTGMVGEAKGLRGEVRDLKQYGRRNRHMIWLAVASIVLDVLVSVALGWNIHKTNETSDRTDAVASTKSEVCRAVNERNKDSRDLWEEFFIQTLTGQETPVEKLERQAKLREAVAVAYAPIRCEP